MIDESEFSSLPACVLGYWSILIVNAKKSVSFMFINQVFLIPVVRYELANQHMLPSPPQKKDKKKPPPVDLSPIKDENNIQGGSK